MKTTRRSFFAWLAAPIVARFAPKPLPVSGVAIAHLDNGHMFYTFDFSRSKELFAELDAHYARMRQEMESDRHYVNAIYADGTRLHVEINKS